MAESDQGIHCDTCLQDGKSTDATALCKECRELYCFECVSCHKKFKVTKHHVLAKIVPLQEDPNTSVAECDFCFDKDQSKILATALCLHCRELYCESCRQRHVRFKATKNHSIHPIAISGITMSSVPDDSINLSSDFEAFTIATDKEILGAQVPVSESKVYPKKYHLDKTNMDNISAKIIKTFNGKVKSDEEDCDFCGIICLNDGRIILLDGANKKLKMFDPDLKISFTKPTECVPFGMTKVSENEIAVVGDQTVFFYTFTNDKFILEDKKFELDADGHGITFNGDIYAIACNILHKKDPFIKLCSRDGQEIRRIASFKETPGWMINLDSENDNLYVQGYVLNISCLSCHGELKWNLDFCGCDVSELYNCLLVTSFTKHAIMLCTKDGTHHQTLIEDKDKLCYPEYMSYNPDTQQLFVTLDENNHIAVIQIAF